MKSPIDPNLLPILTETADGKVLDLPVLDATTLQDPNSTTTLSREARMASIASR